MRAGKNFKEKIQGILAFTVSTWMVRKTMFGGKHYRKKCGMHVPNKPEINTKVCFHFISVYNLPPRKFRKKQINKRMT